MVVAAAFVLVIAAIGSAVVQVINAKAAADDRKEAKAMRIRLQETSTATNDKADKIYEQGVQIHTLADGNLSKVSADLATALSKIDGLEKVVMAQAKAKEIADNLAFKMTRNEPIMPNIPLPIPVEIVDAPKKETK